MTRPPKEPKAINPTGSNANRPERSPATPKRWFNDYTSSPKSRFTPNTLYTSPTTSTPTPNPASTPARTRPAPSTPAPSPPTPVSPAKTPLTPTHTPTPTPSPSTSSAPPSPDSSTSATTSTLPILNTKSDPAIQVGVFTGLGQRKPETLRRGMGVGREQALASRRAIRRLRDLCGGF